MHQNQRLKNLSMSIWNRYNIITPKRPLIEIFDQNRVLIEHHCGVHSYGCFDISVKVSYGLICISGEMLRLRFLSKEKLVITGKIHSVMLSEEKIE